MSRTPSFDTARVVVAARDVFWRQGYEATGISDLERVTGLSRSSLYNAFASKRGLFDAAVQSYLDEVVRPRLAALAAAEVDPRALEGYLRGVRAALASPESPVRDGCLLMNAAGAPIGRETDIAAVIGAYRADLWVGVERGLAARLPDLDAARRGRLADAVTALTTGAFTLVRIDPEAATASLDAALTLIRDHSAH